MAGSSSLTSTAGSGSFAANSSGSGSFVPVSSASSYSPRRHAASYSAYRAAPSHELPLQHGSKHFASAPQTSSSYVVKSHSYQPVSAYNQYGYASNVYSCPNRSLLNRLTSKVIEFVL